MGRAAEVVNAKVSKRETIREIEKGGGEDMEVRLGTGM